MTTLHQLLERMIPPRWRAVVLAAVGVSIFGLTIPMTRLAVGPAGDPQLAPVFVTVARAAVAGGLSAVYLLFVRAPWPTRAQWWALGGTAAGVVFGFPVCLALALRQVPAAHAAVVTGLLPLATALLGAWWMGQHPSRSAWACLGLGCALVLGFAVDQGGGHLQWADALLLGAVLSASAGYIIGTRLTPVLGAPRVISWVLVLTLPITVPASVWAWPGGLSAGAIRPASWAAFAYVAVFSMWLGFFAWYRALAAGARVPGGLLRVSQVQLLQPFVSMLGAVPLLGEAFGGRTLLFALATVSTVALGQRLPMTPVSPPIVPTSSTSGGPDVRT